jgi:5-methylcytosine-specific restriction protein A
VAWENSTRRDTLPPDWEAIRARVLTRDRGRCTWIEHNRRCPARATDVDHIRRDGGDGEENLRGLCRPHHTRKSSREGGVASGAARRARVAARKRPPEPHPGLIS